jgi:hypothetical protein
MAELVDALDLGSSIERCAGSSPVPGTFFGVVVFIAKTAYLHVLIAKI